MSTYLIIDDMLIKKTNEITAVLYKKFENGEIDIVDVENMKMLSDNDEWIDIKNI